MVEPTKASAYGQITKEFEATRPTYMLTLPTGAVFEVYKMDLLEALEIFEHMGISNEELQQITDIKMGTAMITNKQNILDGFITRFVKDPHLRPSSHHSEMNEGELNVNDLHEKDKWALIQEITKRAMGGDKAKADAFPKDTPGQDGDAVGKGSPPTPS